MLTHGSRLAREEPETVLGLVSTLSITPSATEEVFVLLLREVHIVVSVVVRVSASIVAVILPRGARVDFLAVSPSLELAVGDRSALVVVRDLHGPAVSLVVNGFGSKHPLLFLLEAFQDVVRANFHDIDFLRETVFGGALGTALLVLTDLSKAAAGDFLKLQGHGFGVLASAVVEATILRTKGLVLSIGVEIVVSLDVSLALVE